MAAALSYIQATSVVCLLGVHRPVIGRRVRASSAGRNDAMNSSDPVLLVYVKSKSDWAIARHRNWYRLPLRHGPDQITATWVAFYFPGSFGRERWGVYYLAQITGSQVVRRIDLFPHETAHPRAEERYHAISFDRPQRLAKPLKSDTSRRFVYAETTIYRMSASRTLDDVFSSEPLLHPAAEQLLVAVVPRISDFEIVRHKGWYRIPLGMVRGWSSPGHVAFYFGRAFGSEAGLVRFYAPVWNADLIKRIDMLPDEPDHPRAFEDYVRLHIGDLHERAQPIASRTRRRIVILPTTMERFLSASDLNELAAGDEAGDVLYGKLTEERIHPERQYYIRGANAYYLTDFALFCRRRNLQIDVEPGRRAREGIILERGGDQEPASGWEALRLSRYDITRRTEQSVAEIRASIHSNGGMVVD